MFYLIILCIKVVKQLTICNVKKIQIQYLRYCLCISDHLVFNKLYLYICTTQCDITYKSNIEIVYFMISKDIFLNEYSKSS